MAYTEVEADTGTGPKVEFSQRVPYDEYVHASTLHSLQQPWTDDPGEMSFLMITQVMELYFGLLRYELGEAQRLLRDDQLARACHPVRRAALHLEGLNGAWQGLRWMTPADFNRFRDALGEASGFQSAMYRHVELVLGLKSPSLIRPFRRQPETYQELTEALAARSLWDDVIATLARRGFDLPGELLDRDFSVEHEAHPAVEQAWVQIYQDETPDEHLRALGEALTDVAERFGEWRDRHVYAVRRTLGDKGGTGGSSGLAWLRRSAARDVFPELWSARTRM